MLRIISFSKNIYFTDINIAFRNCILYCKLLSRLANNFLRESFVTQTEGCLTDTQLLSDGKITFWKTKTIKKEKENELLPYVQMSILCVCGAPYRARDLIKLPIAPSPPPRKKENLSSTQIYLITSVKKEKAKNCFFVIFQKKLKIRGKICRFSDKSFSFYTGLNFQLFV